MPELPEVETIARELQRVMVGVMIRQVMVTLPKMVKLPLTVIVPAPRVWVVALAPGLTPRLK